MRDELKTKNECQQVREIFIIVFMFLVSVIIRTILAYRYPIHLTTYPDELRYYRIATSFANGTGLSLYNAPYDFQKILYSLCIAPACIFQSIHIRMTAIAFLNSVMMSAGVFPIYYLSSILIKGRFYQIGLCAIYLIGGHMTYTMTFMSENLWIPLALILLSVFCILFTHQESANYKSLWLNFFAGILTYLGYLCKEIALIFPLAYMAYLITWEIYDSKVLKLKKIKWNILVIVVYFIGFAIPFILLKLTIFHAMGNSYNQQGLDACVGDDKIYYLLYGMAYYVMNVLTMSFLFPVILPGMNFGKMKNIAKKLYVFSGWLLLAASFVVSYTISIREDYPSVNPRAHMRYIAWIMPLFIMIFVHLLEMKGHENSKRKRIGQAAIMFGLGIIYTIFYKGIYTGSSVDTTIFIYKGKTPNQVLMINILLIIISVIIVLILHNTKLVMILSMTLILGTQVYDNIYATITHYNKYAVNENMHLEALTLKNYVKANPQSNFLVIDDFLSFEQMTLDTYLTEKNVYVTSYSRLIDMGEDANNAVIERGGIPVIWHEVGSYNVIDINYIIARDTYWISQSDNCSKVQELDLEKYNVFKLMNSTKPIEIIKKDSLNDSNNDLNSSFNYKILPDEIENFAETGFSYSEKKFIWTDGPKAILNFNLDERADNVQIDLSYDTYNGIQSVSVYANNIFITEYESNGYEEKSIIIPSEYIKDGKLILELQLANAIAPADIEPNNNDTRKLALAFYSITLSDTSIQSNNIEDSK